MYSQLFSLLFGFNLIYVIFLSFRFALRERNFSNTFPFQLKLFTIHRFILLFYSLFIFMYLVNRVSFECAWRHKCKCNKFLCVFYFINFFYVVHIGIDLYGYRSSFDGDSLRCRRHLVVIRIILFVMVVVAVVVGAIIVVTSYM